MTTEAMAELMFSFGSLVTASTAAFVSIHNSMKIDTTHAALTEVNEKVAAQVDTIKKLELNTNSIKDALVKVTAEKSHAEGVLEGQAIEKANPT